MMEDDAERLHNEMLREGKDYPDNPDIYSCAISLKRIADALEKLTKVPTVPELTPEQLAEFEQHFKQAGHITIGP